MEGIKKYLIDLFSMTPYKKAKIIDATIYQQPTKYIVKSTDYDSAYKTPVLTAGLSFILGYTNEINGIYKATKTDPVIIFDDFTGAFKWVDFPFKVKSSAMKLIKAKVEKLSLRYLYWYMLYLNFQSTAHKRLWLSQYSKMSIPLPPFPVQEQIVDFLDTIAELEAELEKRKKQYEIYRSKLLHNLKCAKVTLNEICDIAKGRQLNKEVMSSMRSNEYPYPVFNGGKTESGYWKDYNFDKNKITISEGGASAGFVNYPSSPFWAGGHCFVITNCDLSRANYKYLFYFLKEKQPYLQSLKRGAGIPNLHKKEIYELDIPLPPLPVQERVVSILDSFTSFTESLAEGLPAEICLRQRQCEYYRNSIFNVLLQ